MAFSKALYFVALLSPQEVKEEVRKMKMEFQEKYKAAHALKLPAHITLVPPLWLEKEEKFENTLKNVAEKTSPFPVLLKNFGHFGNRVIFIEVEANKLLNRLHNNLRTALTEFLPDNNTPKLHPHISLATRDLQKENYLKAWEEFKDRLYSAEFEIGILTLFRHNGKTWDIIQEFELSGKAG